MHLGALKDYGERFSMVMFSIIIPWYQGTVKDEEFEECLHSLVMQPYNDFEVLIYHDGELLRPVSDNLQKHLNNLKYKLVAEGNRQNIWGHNNRDKGIREAQGKYIIHLNADNVMYPVLDNINQFITDNVCDVYIFRLRMNGIASINKGNGYIEVFKTKDKTKYIILKGTPRFGSIDAMQLITTKNVWLSIGGWYDKTRDSDGIIYESMCKQYDYVNSNIILGEHN
jgi:hypothetical protein